MAEKKRTTKRWEELCDVSDLMETIEMVLLLAEGVDREFMSTTKGGLGKVWKVKEAGEEYTTISTAAVKHQYVEYKRSAVAVYRHMVIRDIDELERIIVEKRL